MRSDLYRGFLFTIIETNISRRFLKGRFEGREVFLGRKSFHEIYRLAPVDIRNLGFDFAVDSGVFPDYASLME